MPSSIDCPAGMLPRVGRRGPRTPARRRRQPRPL